MPFRLEGHSANDSLFTLVEISETAIAASISATLLIASAFGERMIFSNVLMHSVHASTASL